MGFRNTSCHYLQLSSFPLIKSIFCELEKLQIVEMLRHHLLWRHLKITELSSSYQIYIPECEILNWQKMWSHSMGIDMVTESIVM
jgi:hypothetical protein